MSVSNHPLKRAGNILRLNWVELWNSPKKYLVVFSYICIVERDFLPMMKLSEQTGEYMNILEPFINFCNTGIDSILIPFVLLVLLCDYPKANSHYTFTIFRSGRYSWMLGNILFAATVSGAYVIILFLLSVLVCQERCFLYNGWSLYTRKMKIYYNENLRIYGEDKTIDAGLYMHYRPYTAFLLSLLLVVLLGMTIAAGLLLFQVLYMKNVGVICSVLLLLGGWMTYLFQADGMWYLPYANSKLGWHNKYILSETVMPDWYSFAYFAILLSALILCIVKCVKKYQIYMSDTV